MNEKDGERLLKAVANRRRLAIIKYLKKTRKASVGDIAGEIRLSFRSTSKHLSILFAADILEREQESSRMLYSLSPTREISIKNIASLL